MLTESELFIVVVMGTRRLKSLMSLKAPSQKVMTLNSNENVAWCPKYCSVIDLTSLWAKYFNPFMAERYMQGVVRQNSNPKNVFLWIDHYFTIIKQYI